MAAAVGSLMMRNLSGALLTMSLIDAGIYAGIKKKNCNKDCVYTIVLIKYRTTI